MNNFDYAVATVLKHEGGYVFNPKDPGGETKYGISKKSFPAEDIKNLTEARAKEIYYQKFWLPNSFDKLTDPEIAAAALDTVVNHGRGAYLIQEAAQGIGLPLSVDGKIGPDTVHALNTVVPKLYLNSLFEVREAYYKKLVQGNPSLAQFLPGWMTRISKWQTSTGGIAAILALAAVVTAFMLRKKFFGNQA